MEKLDKETPHGICVVHFHLSTHVTDFLTTYMNVSKMEDFEELLVGEVRKYRHLDSSKKDHWDSNAVKSLKILEQRTLYRKCMKNWGVYDNMCCRCEFLIHWPQQFGIISVCCEEKTCINGSVKA